MLQPTKPEEFRLNARPDEVWQALVAEVKSAPGQQILVCEVDDMVVSWVDTSNAGSLAAELRRKNGASLDNWEAIREAEIREVGNDKVAITTAAVATAPGGALLRLRRVYYGEHTQPRIANSSGAYESWLAERVSQKVGSKLSSN